VSCLGDVAAALVDGELDHAARERAQRHLANCAACRAEVDAQRRLKARLTGLRADLPAPDQDLTTRLLALSAAHADVASSDVGRAVPVGSTHPRGARPAPRSPAGVRPRGRPLRRRATAGAGLLALGLTAAFALGGAPPQSPSTPVDPGTEMFVTEFVSTTSDTSPARSASLTSGGVGSGR
jgi:anti-sigma factor RsiW